MKYQVQIKYSNPSHEHVTLRRRVDTITRVVEAANEAEALNRAANQQRSLGFLIKEAAVMNSPKEENLHADEKEKKKKKVVGDDNEQTDISAAGGVKEAVGGTESYPLLKKGEKLKPMKLKEGFDPEPKDIAADLVKKHGKGKVTKDHVDAYERDRDSNKAIDKEAVMKHVEKMSEDVELDEAQKKLKPSYWKAEWRLGTQSEVDKNNKKIFDKLAKTDPVKASAFHDNLMRMRKKDVKEEVEQIDERNMENKAKKNAMATKLGVSTYVYGKGVGVSKYDHEPSFKADPAGFKKVGRSVMQSPKTTSSQVTALKKANEEVVTEAEGTVAVTPKEKALAAHHGDPKKITYGDVIKARLKSAAAKKMGNK